MEASEVQALELEQLLHLLQLIVEALHYRLSDGGLHSQPAEGPPGLATSF